MPVLIVSARAKPSDIDAAMAAGATDYLVKPFRPRHLAGLIYQLLAPAVPGAGASDA